MQWGGGLARNGCRPFVQQWDQTRRRGGFHAQQACGRGRFPDHPCGWRSGLVRFSWRTAVPTIISNSASHSVGLDGGLGNGAFVSCNDVLESVGPLFGPKRPISVSKRPISGSMDLNCGVQVSCDVDGGPSAQSSKDVFVGGFPGLKSGPSCGSGLVSNMFEPFSSSRDDRDPCAAGSMKARVKVDQRVKDPVLRHRLPKKKIILPALGKKWSRKDKQKWVASSQSGFDPGSGGYSYLLQPLWWIGLITMIVGEFANFIAYIYAPAVLVTPLGALSIIVSAVLAHFLLKEKMRKMGILGCVLCVVGSTVIVLHAPSEHSISSVEEIWDLATQPAFLLYTASAIAIVLVLVLFYAPRYGQTNIMVYIGICSIIGSLTVMSIKAIGIAIKLTLEGSSQVTHFQTWVFLMVAVTCIVTSLNYLNKALDTFNTAIVSPIYYAMFTSFTIFASAIMFKDWSGQSAGSIVSVLCGFITVLSGTMVLHSTREPDPPPTAEYSSLSPQISWLIHSNGEIWKQKDTDELHPEYVAIIRQDYFK
ncbi:probable magnesium transporter NIPA1 [Cornus florida]|uniref:probable magnesium transporter NIPA1 n=1 Tax=Cornus florida TaxID=4283 RepID=UPI00289A6417|nr:probable magnesium transporter NIPA1 [Cornus florida]